MDWTSVLTTIIVVALPSILTYIFAKVGIDKLKFAKYEKLWALSREGVLWAKDKFPDNAGAQKLAEVINYVNNALIEMGYVVAPEEIEKAVRAEYQAMKSNVATNVMGN